MRVSVDFFTVKSQLYPIRILAIGSIPGGLFRPCAHLDQLTDCSLTSLSVARQDSLVHLLCNLSPQIGVQ